MKPYLFSNKNRQIRLFMWILGFCSVCLMGAIATKNPEKENMQTLALNQPVVVLELFTSQGCSSCPPADALLGKYAASGGQSIIPLSFHVDYWNRLGWSDPFSQPAFRQRQEWYTSRIPGSSLYTPQLVMDGRYEMVGSNRTAIENQIRKELAEPKQGSILVRQVERKNDRLYFQYEAASPGEILNIALIEKKATTSIHAGENNGLRLMNYNIVRSFHTQKAAGNGAGEISLPRDFTATGYALVMYTQGETKTNIRSAVYLDLSSLKK
ncbi:MAG: DUF1223 domain-containing protein [Bacteroidota bacterium]|nr:DUF1223 domain-containing protein [Bacteroidota bacterium]